MLQDFPLGLRQLTRRPSWSFAVVVVLALGQLVSRMFVTVSARDPLTLGLVAITLLAVTVLAALLPARRAIRMDPTTALRTE